MKRLVAFIFMLSGATLNMGSLYAQYDHLEVSFSSPYPSSPYKKAKTLATKLWSEVNASLENTLVKENLEQTIAEFAHAVLDLNTLCDVLVAEVSSQVNGMTRRYEDRDTRSMLEELQYLLELVGSLEQNFDRTMQGHISDQAACVKVVLDRIQKKMERTLNASAP